MDSPLALRVARYRKSRFRLLPHSARHILPGPLVPPSIVVLVQIWNENRNLDVKCFAVNLESLVMARKEKRSDAVLTISTVVKIEGKTIIIPVFIHLCNCMISSLVVDLHQSVLVFVLQIDE